MDDNECVERIRLTDEYCRAITDFHVRREALRRAPARCSAGDRAAADEAGVRSQAAWNAVAGHIAEHRCLMPWSGPPGTAPEADMQFRNAILITDDERRFVDLNEAATKILGLPRDHLIGRRLDEFFQEARGASITVAWEAFIADGAQTGVCELISPARRRFAYRAKANFAPGFHVSVLREVEQ